jgi:hypothetical protein
VWATVVPSAPCVSSEGSVALAQGQSWSVTLTVPGSPTTWAALHGAFYLSCESGAPFDPATCSAGPIEAIVVTP